MISLGRSDLICLRRSDVISHGRFYSNTTQSLNMEHVGTLAEADDVLSPTIIALFTLLSPPAEHEETCHYCFETITKGQFMVLKLPCCGHLVHTCCFKTWASTSHKESVVHCAYCRTTEKLHAECTTDLAVLLSLLTYDHTLECGQLTNCNRLWVGV